MDGPTAAGLELEPLGLAMSTQTEPQQNSKAEALHLYSSYPFATDETYQVGVF